MSVKTEEHQRWRPRAVTTPLPHPCFHQYDCGLLNSTNLFHGCATSAITEIHNASRPALWRRASETSQHYSSLVTWTGHHL